MKATLSIGIVVPTFRASGQLARCLEPLLASPLRPRILVVDSSSGDGTVEEARRLGAETLVIPREAFNHGATREYARRQLGTDVVAMLTQDAHAADEQALGRLVGPVLAGEVAVSYGRQIARPGAGAFEGFLRSFNYPPESNVRGLEDASQYGAALYFCSNAFAAWNQDALDEVGGFPTTLSHEDAIATALLLKAKHRIAYVADAVVEHSHPYSLSSDFQRYFDAGYARTEYARELSFAGTHASLGARYARAVLLDIGRSQPWLLPYAGAHIAVKGFAYLAGARAVGGPHWIARRLSGQEYFWSSEHYRRTKVSRSLDAPH